MWLITTLGFFSVVQKEGETDLTVRSRVKSDLDSLRITHFPTLGETQSTPISDYPYRAKIKRADFGVGLAQLGASIDYDNFKDAVDERMGSQRAHAYTDVWSTLYALTEKEEGSRERGRFFHDV